MDSLTNLFKKEKMIQLILVILFIVYLIMGYKTPEPIANMIDTLLGKTVIVIIVISLFAYTNPILAVLGLFVAYDLIRRSSLTTGSDALQRYAPSEEKKSSQFTAYNQFPYTLEQEMVKKMAPIIKTNSSYTPSSYKPVLDDLHDAARVNKI